jgi:hypothetical protein
MMIHDIPKSWHIRHRLVYIRMHDMPLQQLNMIIHVHLLTLMDHPFPQSKIGLSDCCVCVAEGKAYHTCVR